MKFASPWFYLFIFVLIFTLSGCKPKGSTTSTANPTIPSTTPTGPTSTLSGTLTYDFISAASGKLNYAGVVERPMRKVYVQAVDVATGSVMASTSTDDSGVYSMSVTTGVSTQLKVFAKMVSPSIIIQDNTNSDAQYVAVTSAFTMSGNMTKNVRATSGWTGSNAAGSYTGTRAAAPFAILDSIYTITKKILTARPSLVIPALKLNWSINNISVDGNRSAGQIGTSFYDSGTKQLYILGQADVDSDEFDNHIIVHEWGHFFEDNLSRSDSGGGSHGSGDTKDMSLAFGEGWGNALSAMAFDPDYMYTDTYGSKQQSGFQINMESGGDSNKGWFSETSVQQILYDIYDSTNEAGDGLSLGIGPILDVFTGYQKTTPAATSIFSFVTGLKTNVPSASTALNTLVATKNIVAITSAYGTGETNNGGWGPNLPLYNSLTLGGAAVAVSLYGDFGASDAFGLFNTAYNNKYLKFTASSATTRLVVTTTDSFEIDVLNKGVEVLARYQPRSSAMSIGPFTYDIATTAGVEYRIHILTAQNVVFDSTAVVDVTVTATAL